MLTRYPGRIFLSNEAVVINIITPTQAEMALSNNKFFAICKGLKEKDSLIKKLFMKIIPRYIRRKDATPMMHDKTTVKMERLVKKLSKTKFRNSTAEQKAKLLAPKGAEE